MAVSHSLKCLIGLRGFPVVSVWNDLQLLMPANRGDLFSCFVELLIVQLQKFADVLKDWLAYRICCDIIHPFRINITQIGVIIFMQT